MAYPTDALKSAISSASAQATSAYAGLSGVVNGADVLSSQLDGLKALVPALQSALNVLSNSSFYAPVGLVAPFGGAYSNIPPSGWLFCDGAAVSRTGTYADLFTVIGVSYGSGDGSSTFNVPDLRGRVPMGQTQYASPSAVSLDSGISTRNHGVKYGAESLPTHTHTGTVQSGGVDHYHGYDRPYYSSENYGSGATSYTVSGSSWGLGGAKAVNTGGSSAYLHGHGFTGGTGTDGQGGSSAVTGLTHGVVQPSLALSFIIKY